MKRLTTTALILALASLAAASCGGPAEQTPQPGNPSAASAGSQELEVTFATEPDPPRAGDTTLDVRVTGPGGQPVTDAEVSVQFFMPAMPEVKMPEMRNSVPLRHEGDGRYRGQGSIMMAGKWDVTVAVTRDGQQIGSRTLVITAE